MKALLDTHTFLWWNTNDPQLSTRARQFIADPSNETLLSVASAWEIAIKAGLGRLTLPEPADRYVMSRMALHRFTSLPVQMSHALPVAFLPHHHNDPFDRLLIAQSSVEGVPLITADTLISKYSIQVIW